MEDKMLGFGITRFTSSKMHCKTNSKEQKEADILLQTSKLPIVVSGNLTRVEAFFNMSFNSPH
jgi:hypothetical protein